MRVFEVGSCAFFTDMPDFVPGDSDTLVVNEDYYDNALLDKLRQAGDVFAIRKMSAQQVVNYCLKFIRRGRIACILVPEVANYFGVTIDQIACIINDIEQNYEHQKRYAYYTIIAKAYIANGDFVLTDVQRQEAYAVYKTARKRYNTMNANEIQ